MASHFVKIYPGFFRGSLTDAPPWARLLFLAMLCEADRHGVVLGTVSFWSNYVRITEEQVRESLTILSSPDPDSTSPAEEGKRIIAWGDGANQWRIVNYEKYYAQGRKDDRRGYQRNLMRQRRARFTDERENEMANGEMLAPVSKVSKVSLRKEKKGKETKEREKETTIVGKKESRFIPPTIAEAAEFFKGKGSDSREAERFINFYESKGWRVGKEKMQVWRASAAGWLSRNPPESKTTSARKTAFNRKECQEDERGRLVLPEEGEE